MRLASFQLAKRRDDWLAGRLTAKEVVAAALAERVPGDWALRSIELDADPGGAPFARLAPDARPVGAFGPGETLPVSVSISHAEGHALCAATWSARESGLSPAARVRIGVDLGAIEPRSPEFVATFFTPEERRWVDDGPENDRALRANLVWCAKEAVLKALGVGLNVDTFALSCVPEPGRADPAEWPLLQAAARAPVTAPDGAAPLGAVASPDPASPEAHSSVGVEDEASPAVWRPFVATCSAALMPGGGEIRGVWRTFPGFVSALARMIRRAR